MHEDIRNILTRVESLLESPEDGPLRKELAEDRPEDIAEVFELLDDRQRSRIIFALPPRTAAEVIALQDEADLGEVVEDLDDQKLTELVAELPPDDAADLIGDLPEDRVEEVLEHVPDEQSAKIEELLTYDEESAGGIMTPDLVAVTGEITVGETVRYVRAASPSDDLHQVYVIDDQGHLVGVVPLRLLVITPKDTPLARIAAADPISVRVNEDQEEVVRVFRKYDLAALPVVDEHNRLKGRITADDVLDVAEEEAAEDLLRMAGTDPAEMETASAVRAAAIRLSWLMPCMLGMTITATVLVFSESSFDKVAYAAIIAFVPMVGAMGGNSGIQISTMIVRGLATGDLAGTRISMALQREGVIALIMAPILGLASAGISLVGIPALQHLGRLESGVSAYRMALAVGLGMTVAVLIAGVLGIALPFLFRRIGVDPAIASGPFVTTTNDVLSVSVYLGLSIVIVN